MAGRVSDPANSAKKPHRKVEYFWLCPTCARELTVKMDSERGVITVPIAGSAVHHATA